MQSVFVISDVGVQIGASFESIGGKLWLSNKKFIAHNCFSRGYENLEIVFVFIKGLAGQNSEMEMLYMHIAARNGTKLDGFICAL